jgi:hypothetical protein
VVALVADKVMVAVAGRIPRRPTFPCLPDQSSRLRLALPVLVVADLERLVATHISTEPLLPPQALGQREVEVARHQRPAAVVPLLLGSARPNILAAMVDHSTAQLTVAPAVAVRPAKTEMALRAAGVAPQVILIPAVVAVALVAVLLARMAFLELPVAMAATITLPLAAALVATTRAVLLRAPAIPAQQAAVAVVLAQDQQRVLVALMMVALVALELNTPRTAQAVAVVALLLVALAVPLAALAVSMAAAVVADLPEAGHQGLWVALALKV